MGIQTSSINSGPVAGFKNLIINGNFDIWQRENSVTGTNNYGADRWKQERTGSTCTYSKQTFTVGQTDVPNGPTYFARFAVTSSAGAGNRVVVTQSIENILLTAGQTVTLSFWAKADSAKPISIEGVQGMGTGGTPSANVNPAWVQKVTLSTSWQKYTITKTFPSVSGKTLGTDGIHTTASGIVIWFDAGSSFNARTDTLGQQSGTFDIAQVQMEIGSVATNFEMRPISTEMDMCSRYCRMYRNLNNGTIPLAVVIGTRATGADNRGTVVFQFPTEMRVAPTVSCPEPSGFRPVNDTIFANYTTFSTSDTSKSAGQLTLLGGGTGFSNGQVAALSTTTSSAYILFDSDFY